MANSATLLADLIDSWHVPGGKTPEQHRGGGHAVASLEFWTEHVRAVRWLNEVEDALTAMEAMGENVEHYRTSQPAWFAAVFGQSVPWGSSQPAPKRRRIADPRDVALLRALGQQLDSVRYTPRVDAVDLGALRAAIDEAGALIEASAIDDSVRRYLLGLIAEVRHCLEDLDSLGTVRLREVTFTLGGAMSAAAESSVQEADKPRWQRAAVAVVSQLSIQGTAGALGTIAAHLITGV